MKLKTVSALLLSLLSLNACGEPQIVYVYQPMPNYQQAPQGYYGPQAGAYNAPMPNYQNPNQMYQPQGYNNMTQNQQLMQPQMNQRNGLNSQLTNTAKPANNQLASLPAGTKTQTAAPSQPSGGSKLVSAMTTEEKVLAKARTSFDAIQTLQATVTTFEKDFSGKEGTGQVKMFYRKPGQFKIEVINSPDAGQIGVKLAYSSGSDVKVRPSGALSLVSVSLGMTDNKLLSGRKYQLNQIDLAATVQRLTAPGSKTKLMGQTQMNGSNVILVEVIPQSHFDSKITREVIGLDSSTFLPRIHEMYQGEQKVYGVQVPNITPNAPLPPDTFEV